MRNIIVVLIAAFLIIPTHERGKKDWSSQDNVVIDKSIDKTLKNYKFKENLDPKR